MKNKIWIKYIIYLIIFLIMFSLHGYLTKQQILYKKENFEFNFIYLLLLNLIRIVIGMFLGLDFIVKESKKNGKWKINLYKIVFMVIPFIYLSIFNLFLNSNTLETINLYPFFLFENDISFVYISQIILGFCFITSFYKK